MGRKRLPPPAISPLLGPLPRMEVAILKIFPAYAPAKDTSAATALGLTPARSDNHAVEAVCVIAAWRPRARVD